MAQIGYGYGSEFHLMRFLGHHRNLLENEILTVKVLVVLQWNEDPARKHIEICDMCNTIGSFKVNWVWNCSCYYTVTHWMPLPNFPE